MKIIVINKDEGQYAIPLEIVAKDRATYLAQADGFEENSEDWQDEIDSVMDDDFEGIDWLLGNMDWADVEFAAIRLNAEQKMQEDFWTCSDDFEIRDVDEKEFPFSIWRTETRKNYPDKFLEI
jgi:hypothetical protein